MSEFLGIGFWVKGIPKAQPRPKATRRGNRILIYTPDSADEWKRAVRKEVAFWASANTPVDWPCEIELEFYMPRIQSHFRSEKKQLKLKDNAPSVHASKPDVDNLAKAVIDALVNAKVIKDDNLVWRLDVSKIYSPSDFIGCKIDII